MKHLQTSVNIVNTNQSHCEQRSIETCKEQERHLSRVKYSDHHSCQLISLKVQFCGEIMEPEMMQSTPMTNAINLLKKHFYIRYDTFIAARW